MSTRRIMNIVGLCLVVMLIIGLFIPIGDNVVSYWEGLEHYGHFNVVLLIEFLLVCVFLILQICGVLKDSKMALLPVGYLLNYSLFYFFGGLEFGMDQFGFGYYYMLIVSIAAAIVLCIAGLVSNEKKPKPIMYNVQPKGFDPQTGKPIYAQPKGFNPKTGEPIY